MSNMMSNRDFSQIADIEWKPLYPNNMKCNGLEGCYCVMFYKHKDGIVSARKYTIAFQRKELKPGTGLVEPNSIDRYVLFEKSYPEVIGPLEHPEPTDNWIGLDLDSKDTFNRYDVNSYGDFVYAYEDLEVAKQRAYAQFWHIDGYIMSFLDDSQK